MKDKIINQALATGRFPKTTIDYWMDWLSAWGAIPPDHIALLDFITEQEQYIGDALHEAIPHTWRQD